MKLLDVLKQSGLSLGKRIYRGFYTNPGSVRIITNQFHRLYYHTPHPQPTWVRTTWLGKTVLKCPFDLWIYQEILYELRPDVIVECGTAHGGGALYLASLCDLMDHGRIITIDILEREGRPVHPRITFLTGSSVSDEILNKVRSLIKAGERVMVLLDSDHSMDHVLEEMKRYGQLVTPGSYMVVEDTNVNGHPVAPFFGPGPMEAVHAFLKENDTFVIDKEREKFFLTFNPNGYLKKVK